METLEIRALLSTVPHPMHHATKANLASAQLASPAKQVGAWTVMVYITGDNLNDSLARNILQMENLAAQLPQSVKLVVFWSQPTEQNVYHKGVIKTGDNTQTWTSPITGGMAVIQGAKHVIPDDYNAKNLPPIQSRFENMSAWNSGDPKTVDAFISYARSVAPAKHYAMIFSDHGEGVNGFNNDGNFTTVDADGSPIKGSLNAPKLAQSLARAAAKHFKLDLLAFDECLMASTEVELGLARYVTYIVASEELIPGAGFDYDKALAALASHPWAITSTRLAQDMVQSYGKQYRDEWANGDTLSAVNTRRLGEVAEGLRRFVRDTASLNAKGWAALQNARSASAVYGIAKDTPFRDLGQFLNYSKAHSPNPRLKLDAAFTLKILNQTVFAKTSDKRQSTGLHIVLPQSPETVPTSYSQLAAPFLRSTHWQTFLSRFMARTPASTPFEDQDWAENNNTPHHATNLESLTVRDNQPEILPKLTLPRHDVDWYKFKPSRTNLGEFLNTITIDGAAGSDIRMQLYQARYGGPRANFGLNPYPIASGGTSISPEHLQANHQYFLRVIHSKNGPGVGYSLVFATNSQGRSTARNAFPTTNTRFATAYNLGTVSLAGVASVRDGMNTSFVETRTDATTDAWYQFQTPRSETSLKGTLSITGAPGQSLRISLYTQSDTLIKTVEGSGMVTTDYTADGGAEPLWFSIGGDAGSYQMYFTKPTSV